MNIIGSYRGSYRRPIIVVMPTSLRHLASNRNKRLNPVIDRLTGKVP